MHGVCVCVRVMLMFICWVGVGINNEWVVINMLFVAIYINLLFVTISRFVSSTINWHFIVIRLTIISITVY